MPEVAEPLEPVQYGPTALGSDSLETRSPVETCGDVAATAERKNKELPASTINASAKLRCYPAPVAPVQGDMIGQ